MKKKIAILAVLTLLVFMAMPAYAQPFDMGQPLAGEEAYPDGSTTDNARFMLTYSFPQIVPVTEEDAVINTFYQEAVDDLVQMTAPMLYDEVAESIGQDVTAYLDVSCQVTANTDDFFSVLVTQEQFMGASVGQMVQGNVFARKGDGADGIVTLPYVLGFSPDDEVSATSVIDTVYNLVWEIIVEQMKAGSVDYFEELTQENLFAEFYPESDFYLDEQGNIVFYIQPAALASAAAGVLTFPFSPAEIMSEMPPAAAN